LSTESGFEDMPALEDDGNEEAVEKIKDLDQNVPETKTVAITDKKPAEKEEDKYFRYGGNLSANMPMKQFSYCSLYLCMHVLNKFAIY